MRSHILQHQPKENAKQIHSAKKITEFEKPPEGIYDSPLRFPTKAGTTPPGFPFTSNHVQLLQRTIGNQAVGRFIQAKLKIGQPNDKYEQEADRIADEVMRMSDPQVQRQPVEEEENVQTKAAGSEVPSVSASLLSQINSLSGGGQPLPPSVRAFFEPRFGVDFSQVRIHTDGQANESARSIKARAFTFGHDIVLGEGQYESSTIVGKKLLAHELTHIMQQGLKTQQNTTYLNSNHYQNVGSKNISSVIQRDPEESEGKFPFSGMPAKCKRGSTKEAASGPPAKNRFRVRACIDTNELFVEELQPPYKAHFHTLVVTGGEKTPTPKGEFLLKGWEKDYTTPRWKEQSCTPWSKDTYGRNVFGPYILPFKGGYFIHGTVGPGISPITLNGIAMGNLAGSHGCIRVSNKDLKSLHDGLLSNPVGTTLLVTTCGSPPEANYELVPRATLTLGDEKKPGFVQEFRVFLPTLIKRRLQPFVFVSAGTEGMATGIGTSIDPFMDMGLFLAGKGGIQTDYCFHSAELGAGLEAGWAFGKSRSLRLGVGWETWEKMDESKKRSHLLNLFLGVRY